MRVPPLTNSLNITTIRLPVSRPGSVELRAASPSAESLGNENSPSSLGSDTALADASDARFWTNLLGDFAKLDIQSLADSNDDDNFGTPVGGMPVIMREGSSRRGPEDMLTSMPSMGPDQIKRLQGTLPRTPHGRIDIRAPMPTFELDLAEPQSAVSVSREQRRRQRRRRRDKYSDLILGSEMSLLEDSLGWSDDDNDDDDDDDDGHFDRELQNGANGCCYRFSLVGRGFRNALIAATPKRTMGIAAIYYMTGQGADKYRGTIVGRVLKPESGLEGLYQLFLESCQSEFAQILKSLAGPLQLPVIFLANHGKDRIGLLCALVQHICGVPPAQIYQHYELSEELLEPVMTETHDDMRLVGFDPYIFSRSPAKVLRAAFEYLTLKFGSIESYLDQIGITSYYRTLIRDRLVDFEVRSPSTQHDP